MVAGIQTAVSALHGFSAKLAVVSNNVANFNTDGFTTRRASIQEKQYGGIEVSIQQKQTPPDPIADSEPSKTHDKEASNVDLTEEITHMLLAARGFEANIRCFTTQDEMQSTVLDIIG
ncbi:MAG: flagellar basal body rod C-terminal domain-containing protein [Thermodesulfobacteriota bacterium]